MRHQSVRDRLDEGEGMVRREMHHSSMGIYRNEVEKPEVAPMGHMEHGMGMYDFKGEADPIAYGQSSEEGCRADEKRMRSQFKDYHWD